MGNNQKLKCQEFEFEIQHLIKNLNLTDVNLKFNTPFKMENRYLSSPACLQRIRIPV